MGVTGSEKQPCVCATCQPICPTPSTCSPIGMRGPWGTDMELGSLPGGLSRGIPDTASFAALTKTYRLYHHLFVT